MPQTLRRPRPFGNCWLASELWHQLGMTGFWREHLPEGREAVSWVKVLRLLVVNRLIEPDSEFLVHRHWFVESAMDNCWERFSSGRERPLGTVQLIDVWIPAQDGRWLILPRYTQPAKDLQVLPDRRLACRSQPPPRITAPLP